MLTLLLAGTRSVEWLFTAALCRNTRSFGSHPAATGLWLERRCPERFIGDPTAPCCLQWPHCHRRVLTGSWRRRQRTERRRRDCSLLCGTEASLSDRAVVDPTRVQPLAEESLRRYRRRRGVTGENAGGIYCWERRRSSPLRLTIQRSWWNGPATADDLSEKPRWWWWRAVRHATATRACAVVSGSKELVFSLTDSLSMASCGR